jgi:acyl-CoA synthetase (AMP-forming)/AMP-acid ligase II
LSIRRYRSPNELQYLQIEPGQPSIGHSYESVNIGRMLSATASRFPGRPAVTWGSTHLTYRDLDHRVNSLASGLARFGLKRGDRVAFILWNRPEIIETMYAAFKLGLCVVPLNARFVGEEIVYHTADSRARALVFDPASAGAVASVRSRLEMVEFFLSAGSSRPGLVKGSYPYESVIADNSGSPEQSVDLPADQICWLFYTSGTTGRPKGAMLTHANLLFVALSWVTDLMRLGPDDVTLHAAPLTHGAGFHALAAIAKGAHQLIPTENRFRPDLILDLMESAGVTNTWMVPTQVRRLAEIQRARPRTLSRLQSVVYGGAPFHLEDLKEAIEQFGQVLVQIYGQGETPMTGTYLPQAEHVLGDPVAEERLGSAGYSRTGVEVRIHDDHDRMVPYGERGEIVIRGPSVMSGYWERPGESAETLRGGWLHTGDIGRMDESGYLFVLDRKKDLIISGGSNVYAREVEEVLVQHPGVQAAAVIGLPDQDLGERVVAVIVPQSGAPTTGPEIMEHCRSLLAGYKRPKEIHFVDALPISAYGKVLKRDLRERFKAEQVTGSRD